ncbi:hypothetical protein BGW39_009920 [Mortierella sp. 14UC]|nr:hypothetical protein BGW39_009920 [Mortierella sp. 14UC]
MGSMDTIIPDAVVRKYSHLLRVLDLVDWSFDLNPVGDPDLSLFMCRNLIELHSHVGIHEGQKRAAKQLVRANSGIRKLVWMGAEVEACEYGTAPVLEVEDFVGFRTGGGGGGGGGVCGGGLESLRLVYWDCSSVGTDCGGGQLREILRIVGGSLKELDLDQMYNVSPEGFSASHEEEELHGESIHLELVETLRLGYCGEVDQCSAELVKCCPKLRKLQYNASYSDESIDCLAASLEQHCLEFESLELNQIMEPRAVETLIRHCRRQLRTLRFSVTSFENVDIGQGQRLSQGQGQGQGSLALAILEHAGTLEDICINKVSVMDAGPFYLQLLVGCTRLKRFAFNLCGVSSDDRALLEALRQRVWSGCRGTLEELEFEVQFRRGGIKATANTVKEMRRMASEMGPGAPVLAGERTPVLRPKTLVACLQVCKLWHRTLLPILWYGFWRDSTPPVPREVLDRYSHLFKALSLYDSPNRPKDWDRIPEYDRSYLHCTKLVELSIELSRGPRWEGKFASYWKDGIFQAVTGQGKYSGLPVATAAPPPPHSKRLLRSNPHIKNLSWAGHGLFLDAEDFVGFVSLEILRLLWWDGTDGGVERVLRVVSGSLKELAIACVKFHPTQYFSALPPPTLPTTSAAVSSSLQDRCNDRDVGSDNGEDELLKRFAFGVGDGEWDLGRIGEILRTYCPELESLSLSAEDYSEDAIDLIRNFSQDRPPQFRSILLNIDTMEYSGLVPSILLHASTLQEFSISTVCEPNEDGPLYLQLLVGCSSLRTVNILSLADANFIEALKVHRWGCRSTLRELEFGAVLIGQGQYGENQKSTRRRRQEVADVHTSMGWEFAEGILENYRDDQFINPTNLREVFELVRMQELEGAERVWINRILFRRIGSSS